MSMTLSFLDDSERLKRIGEPSADELQRQQRAKEMAQSMGADNAAPALKLMTQGAVLGAGLASMLQQGAGNGAVVGLLAGGAIAGARSMRQRNEAEAKPKKNGSQSKESEQKEKPKATEKKEPPSAASSSEQESGGQAPEQEEKKKRSGGIFGGINKALQQGAEAVNQGITAPVRSAGDAANKALRSGLDRAQQPVDRAAKKASGLGANLRAWGDRQNTTLNKQASKVNAKFQAPTQKMSGFAGSLRQFGDRQNARIDNATARANQTLARPTSRFQAFGSSLRSWGDRQNAKMRNASLRANRALERPAERGGQVGNALRQFGNSANAKLEKAGEGLVNRYFDRENEDEFWKGQKRRQLGNKLNRALLGDDYNSKGMAQLPQRLDGRKWGGIPSQLTTLVSESQRNLPPQVLSHLSGFLAKVTPEMESQMSPGEKERLEQLREIVRQNEAREEQDSEADRREAADAQQGNDSESSARSPQPEVIRAPAKRQDAGSATGETPETAAAPQASRERGVGAGRLQRAGISAQGTQAEAGGPVSTEPGTLANISEVNATGDAPSAGGAEPTAAEVDIPEGPLVDLEPTGDKEPTRAEAQAPAVRKQEKKKPTVDERTRREQQAVIDQAQACATGVTRAPARSTADGGGAQLAATQLRENAAVQEAQQQVPSGSAIEPGNTTPRTLSQLGEAHRGRMAPARSSGRTSAQNPGQSGPGVIGDRQPAVRSQPELPSIEERRGRSMDGVGMSTVPVNLPDNRALDGNAPDSRMAPEGQPQKTAAQVESEARMVGDEAQRQLDVAEQGLQDEAQAEADTRTAAAEAERDQREQIARADGDARIAAEEQQGQQRRAEAEAQGQQRRAAAEAEQQSRKAAAEAEGQQREAAAETAREAQRAVELQREQSEISAAEQERERQQTELRCQIDADERAAELESEGRQAEARRQGDADQAQLEREGEADQARLRSDARSDAARLEQEGRRDAQRREQEGASAQRREEQRGRQRQRRLEAEARRQRSSQGWLSRAASWVASKFNSLMNRARQAFNSAVRAGRRLLQRARDAAAGLMRRAREAASRVIAAADRACGGVITRVRNAVRRVADRVSSAISAASQWLREKAAQLAARLREGLEKFANACRRAIKAIRDSVRAAIQAAVQAFQAAVQAARTWVQQQIAAARKWLQDTWNSITSWVEARYNEIRDAVVAAVNTIVTAVTTAVTQAYNWCAERLSEIGTWLSEKWDQFCEWAQEAFVKFWTGPWRDILIGVGVALLIAAVTVATGGAGLAVIVAVSAGATAAARAGGEIAARRAAVAIKNDPERAARFQAEMEAEGGEAQRWYDGVAEDEEWMTTLGHGAVEGARGAVEGAVNGLVGGAAGAVSTRIAGGIAKAGAREGARVMGRVGVQRAAEFGTRMTVDAGLSLGGDVAMGAVNVELDVAMGIRSREEAYEMHIQQHLNPSSMAARLAGSGLTGGLRMGSHRGADSAIQDRIVQRVMGDAGREATDKAANRVMRETVDMTIGAADGGMQGGLMSMANGGSFSEGFAQGFVGGAASHGGQLAGERAGRRAIRPAPDTAGMVRNRTGNGADIDPTLRQDLSSDPTRRDGATDIDAGIRRTESDVDATTRTDVETADGRQRPPQDDETQFIRIPPEQIEASRLQSQIAGLHGVPAAIRVVPDSMTPRPAGTISATQARRWQKTVADLETTPTGRDTLRHIQEKGVKVRLEDHAGGFFVPGANEIILGMNIRGRSNRSGVLAHEGGHSRHRDLVPEMETSSRDGYVRGMAQDEARAQILLFEHHLEQGRIPDNQAGYDTYMDAYHTERQRLQADHPEMSDIEVHERARQRGEDKLADFWGQNMRPNDEAKNADGGSPTNYDDYYGSYWDAMDSRRQKQSQALPSADGKLQAPEGDATSARRQLNDGVVSDSTVLRSSPTDAAFDPMTARNAPPDPSTVRDSSPIRIPEGAETNSQRKSAGYDQIKFRWDEGEGASRKRYESRWHTRTPGAPEGAGATWVVTRTTPGLPDGSRRKSVEVLVGDSWVPQHEWQSAVSARKSGTATEQQQRLLDHGHHHGNDPDAPSAATKNAATEIESPSADTSPSFGPGSSRRRELDLPETGYQDRIRILAESDGKVTSTEAYTKTDDTSWAKLSDPETWVPERRQLHDRLIDRAKQDSRAFAEAMSDHPDTIYAMRGNTAAGKTRAIRSNIPELADAIDTTGNSPHRAINPDNFKLDLIRHDQDTHGVSNSHQQVHVESSTLAWRLKGELMDAPGSLLVDQRLGYFEDVQGLMQNAQRTGRKFNVYDVDAPLEMSLVGVLMRKPGGADPIPPFSVVAEGGFVPARENRRRSMALFEGPEGASVGKYEVFGTTADGRKIRVAEVVNGERIIHDREAYSRMQEKPQLEVDRLRGETIDDAVIARVVGPLPKDFGDAVRAALEPYKGRNWDAALTEHGRPRQSQETDSAAPKSPSSSTEIPGPRTTDANGSMVPMRPSGHSRVDTGNLPSPTSRPSSVRRFIDSVLELFYPNSVSSRSASSQSVPRPSLDVAFPRGTEVLVDGKSGWHVTAYLPDQNSVLVSNSSGRNYRRVLAEEITLAPGGIEKAQAQVDSSVKTKLQILQNRVISEVGVRFERSFDTPNGAMHISQLFSQRPGRKSKRPGRQWAVIAVETPEGVFTRMAYQSSSQGVFRLTDWEYDQGYIGKGPTEGAMGLPSAVQEHLLSQVRDKQGANTKELERPQRQDIMRGEPKMHTDDTQFFQIVRDGKPVKAQEGGPRVFAARGGYEMDDALAPLPKNREQITYDRYNELSKKHQEQPDAYLSPEAAGLKKLEQPESVHIQRPEHQPEFSSPVRHYKTTTSLTDGEVEVMVYRSKDGSIEYTFMVDNEGKAWVADAYKVQDLNDHGMPKAGLDFGDLTSPRWEYAVQVGEGYRGAQNPKDMSYASNWSYISRLPIIRDFYAAHGLSVPKE